MLRYFCIPKVILIMFSLFSFGSKFHQETRARSLNPLSEAEEPSVMHVIRCDVIVIMSSFSVSTEAVKVLNTQVEALQKYDLDKEKDGQCKPGRR